MQRIERMYVEQAARRILVQGCSVRAPLTFIRQSSENLVRPSLYAALPRGLLAAGARFHYLYMYIR